jgi:hypothetical protein
MAGGDPKYDLSPNDRAAIGVALDGLTRLDEARKDRDVAESRKSEAFQRLRRERDEAQAAFSACAHAIGVEHVPDCGPSAPGPVDEVVAAIREAVRARDERGEEVVALRGRVRALTDALDDVLGTTSDDADFDAKYDRAEVLVEETREWLFETITPEEVEASRCKNCLHVAVHCLASGCNEDGCECEAYDAMGSGAAPDGF